MSVITQAFSDAFQLLASGDEETFAAVQATLSTSGLAMLGCIIPGVPLGFLLGYSRFPGRNMLRILVDTALSFPTVVLGLLVYLLLARKAVRRFRAVVHRARHRHRAGPARPPHRHRPHLPRRGTGRQTACPHAPHARRGAVAIAVLHSPRTAFPPAHGLHHGFWARGFGGGHLHAGRRQHQMGHRTITTAITLETGKGDYARSIALGIVLVTLAFVLNMGLAALRRRMGP